MAPDSKLPEIYLQPGEWHLARGPAILRTVLGSCVGIAFLDLRHGVAALCHPMLPHRPVSRSMDSKDAGRYVDAAIRQVANQLDALGIQRNAVQVKLFGGADVLTVSVGARQTIGHMNCEAAKRVLREEGFAIKVSRLGGTSGLHLEFHTGTGEVRVRRLNGSA